ncbi:MAG: helix-turn-helix transcriptional regulator [Lachnospiraceae bacterium]|nr:helix-turn-helix transcriptional regulator [Lachnospiraceae bacterium]
MALQYTLENNIAEWRELKGVTQSELAEAIGVSRNTISSIETLKYNPSALIAAQICSYFDCGFEEIFFLVQKDIPVVGFSFAPGENKPKFW